MTNIIQKMKDWVSLLPPLGVTNILEIIILSVFVYECLLWIKNTRAWQLLKGLLVVAAFTAFAAIFQMTTIMWLIERLSTATIIAAIVIFQPELRRALEQLGSKNYFVRLFPEQEDGSSSQNTINEIAKAVFAMARVKTGALIVLQQKQSLKEIEDTGIRVDGIVSSALLINTFEKNTPLHDGAVIIEGDRMISATCYLPLSNAEISKDYGTRHRAALGISEVTDAITIVVSEETGRVSLAEKGHLIRVPDQDALRDVLPTKMIEKTEPVKEKNIPRRILKNKGGM